MEAGISSRALTLTYSKNGVRVTPPRYHLDIDYPDAPKGAAQILDKIMEKCEGLVNPSITDGAEEEKPSKKARESEQVSVTAATAIEVPGGDIVLVEEAAASEL